jgi:OOP family OmpA-OmpF porin
MLIAGRALLCQISSKKLGQIIRKADLKPTAEAQLQNLLTVVRANPSAAVLVEGHTDGRGTEVYNRGLSVRRAGSVMGWLAAHGTSSGTITTKGWGAARPIAPNKKPDGSDDPEGRQKNRRGEIAETRIAQC